MLKDVSHGGFSGSVNPTTIDPRYVEKERLTSSAEINTITSEELSKEIENTEQKMLYAFAAFSLVMLVTGLGIGSFCIYFIVKKLKTGQYQDAASNKTSDGPGHFRSDSTMPI